MARLLAALTLLLLPGCAGYYADWLYAPTREVHRLHVNGAADAAAEVSAAIVGVLRAEEVDGVALPRRIHVRLEVGNETAASLELATAATRLAAPGLTPFVPRETEPLAVARGERRRLELHFPLPNPAECREEQLESLELTFVLTLDGAPLHGRARFVRASPWSMPGWHDPWWHPHDPWGPPWYGPGSGWHGYRGGGAWWWRCAAR
ncbi:MAG: hypothetical protein FJ293_15250 [Planctomycetes bacterium]|nr:hypothetical protein [Planctomycetota bacterium]